MTVNNPPSSPDSEQALIACIVQHGKTEQAVREAMDRITPEMLYFARNREIYKVCQNLKVIDYGLLAQEASKQNSTIDLAYLVEIKRSYTPLKNLKSHVSSIIKSHYQRELISIGGQVAEQALAKQEPIDIKDYIFQQLQSIEDSSGYQLKSLAELMPGYFNLLQDRAERKERVIGVETGITDLDKQIIGIDKTWLVVLAGRPSNGKSLVAQMIANHISRSKPTIFFSLEMGETEILDRLVCLETGFDEKDVRQALLSDEKLMKLKNLTQEIKDGKLNQFIDTTPQLSLNQIKYRCKEFKKQNPNAGLIQIDYLGLMESNSQKYSRHDLAIADITKGLKAMAKELEIPVMLLVQANRDADKAKRLGMHNLADAAAIERDSDLVLFTHRDEVNDPDTNKKGIIELTPAKFRHGTFDHDVYLKKKSFGYECVNPASYKQPKKTYSKGFDLDGAA